MVHYFDRSKFIMVDYNSNKQKAVIKLSMENNKIRTKALKTAVCIDNIISVSIDGDKMVCMGCGVDNVALVVLLRKKLGYADLISVTAGIWDEERSDADGTDSSPTGSLQPICCFPV